MVFYRFFRSKRNLGLGAFGATEGKFLLGLLGIHDLLTFFTEKNQLCRRNLVLVLGNRFDLSGIRCHSEKLSMPSGNW